MMNQCLRCNNVSKPDSIFCNECQTLLRNQIQVGADGLSQKNVPHASAPVALYAEDNAMNAPRGFGRREQQRFSSPIVQEPQTPPPPVDFVPELPVQQPGQQVRSGLTGYTNIVEMAMHKLSDAARRVAQAEPGQRRIPHVPRLKPLRDISAEIQRHSTPMLKVSESGRQPSQDLGKVMPDLWPWLHDPDAEESENDQWQNRTDPLLGRHFPNSKEVALLEEEDMRRALAEGKAQPYIAAPRRSIRNRRLRTAFICLTALAVLALAIDTMLVSAVLLHSNNKSVMTPNGPPSLTLSSNIASYGQSVLLHIKGFTPLTQVFLSHDIQEPIQTNLGTKLITLGSDGSKDVSMLIEDSWEPGFHTIEAEDITTRYTASAWLQIPAGPTPPPHLTIDRTELDLGAGSVGANTIQPLTLHNSGSGPITWAASSNQSWLQVTPNQGVFSDSQTVAVGVQRAHMAAGNYTGKITFSSNVGAPLIVDVQMSVRPLIAVSSPVLTITPAVLTFNALDGGNNPDSQVLVVSNPGAQPLHWTLTDNAPSVLTGQSSFLHSLGASVNWLSVDQSSGTIVPGATSAIHVLVNSQNLLPGSYINTLVFTADQGTLNSPQNVSVSLTVQQRCGLTLSAGTISFTAVSGQNNPSNQLLSLASTPSCSGAIPWKASTSVSWLTLSVTGGILKNASSAVTAVGVNANGLNPGSYSANITVTAGQNTQSVMVMLTVQPPPPPSAPIMAASPLNLSFSTTQGQPNPAGQGVTITNPGGSILFWHTAVNQLASSWLGVSPTGGSILAGQTGQVVVNINTSSLTPGNYVGQVVLSGVDASNQTAGGSPQTITVNLLVLPPCVLQQPSSDALAFNGTQGGSSPASQTVTITATGNCGWPMTWKASATSATPWLNFTPASGSFSASGQSASLTIAPSLAGLTAGTYTAQVAITASSSSVTVQGGTQVISITFTVQPPCALQVTPSGGLTFSVTEGQSSSSQSLAVSESGNCSRPVTWSATGDSGSITWLAIAASSGTDSGSGGTVSVSVNATTLIPGNYTGSITITASGSGGGVVQGSPVVVPITVTVTGFKVSGIAYDCSDTTCATPIIFAGAKLNLVNSSGTTVLTVTADTTGKYTFTNVPLGTYTITASGTDGGGVKYAGTTSVTITGDKSSLNINLFVSS